MMEKVKLIEKAVPQDSPGAWKCRVLLDFQTEDRRKAERVAEAIRQAMVELPKTIVIPPMGPR